MYSIAVATKKGGAGKSTLIAHLATALAELGERPLILDCDTAISSLYIWGKAGRAGVAEPEILKADAETIEGQLKAAAERALRWVFIDVPAGGGDLVARAASLAHLVLIPVRASSFDLAATKQTIDMLKRTVDDTEPIELACRTALGKAAIVLNGIPANPSRRWRADIESALGQCGAGGLDIVGALGERAAYRTSLERGRGVAEEGRSKPAIDEIHALLRKIKARAAARAEALRRMAVSS